MKLKDKNLSRGTTPKEIYEEDTFWSHAILVISLIIVLILIIDIIC